MFQKCVNFNYFSARFASRLEVLLIGLVMFTLPIFEAPKNIFTILLILVWILISLSKKSLGVSTRFDLPLFGLTLVLWLGPPFSTYGYSVVSEYAAARWSLLALFVLLVGRLNYTREHLYFIWFMLLLGGVVAVCESFWIWSINNREYPELRSVGHTNHSAMYILVILAAGISATLTSKRMLVLLGALSVSVSLLYLPASRSIVSTGTAFVVISVAMLYFCREQIGVKWISLGGVILAAGISLTFLLPFGHEFWDEIIRRFSGEDIFSGRDRILNAALAVWRQNPIFGTGWFSFGPVTSEESIRLVLQRADIQYDASTFIHTSHGHNLWTTILVERGLMGLILITVILFMYIKFYFYNSFMNTELGSFDRIVSLAALLVAVGFAVGGLGNTTMMNEHGHAGMAFIAMTYGYLRGRAYL